MAIGPAQPSGLIGRGTLAAFLVASALVVPAAGGVRAAGPRLHSTAPCMPAGHGPGVIPAISFGRKSGNIRPFSVAVYADGSIAYNGTTPVASHYAIHPVAVLGLERLAAAEGFATWPATIKARHMMPDAATLFITLRAGCSTTTHTVNLRGGAVQPSFSELFDTLEAATALAG